MKYDVPTNEPGKFCTCGKHIWFVKTKTGAFMPIEKDGEPHWGRCEDEKAYRYRNL